ncbi:TetR/AcrR family transcriptional regulator [Lentzea flaviverrucosa]|uniref:Transcriptional regulator, TetR family n=1 Tax=Lentzea flaviverrucosa TaxID=200379 RepID=A0A1H9HC33_9PSEU|nr:TetR/AcrR family transcriptional regulator [Lentzea flaviverrucosa]RDI34637.1 TetR family transcriptional regulator [Lentzea flaviverrucosa]SEQ59846.1 transcriptional regulator, TetR family [Lentzea flaviverrucosa]
MGLREAKMERTRRFIAESAFDLFVAQGYDDTTIEQIAAAAEVGTRTLYRYYATKEALVVSFVQNGLDAAMEAFLAQPDETPLPEALHAVIGSVEQTIATNSARLLALYEIFDKTTGLRAGLADLCWSWRQRLAQEILRREGGTGDVLFAALTAASTMNVIEVVVQTWTSGGGRAEVADIARETLELLHTKTIPFPAPAG